MRILQILRRPRQWFGRLRGRGRGAILTIVIYAALTLVPLVLSRVIGIGGGVASAVAMVIALALVSRVALKGAAVSESGLEGEVTGLRQELREKTESLARATGQREELEEKLSTLEKHRARLADLEGLWEINFLKIENSIQRAVDYLIPAKRGAPEEWQARQRRDAQARALGEKPQRIENGDRRAIGAFILRYTSKIGIDLRNVKVARPEGGVIRYVLPAPSVSGVVNQTSDWHFRVVLRHQKQPWQRRGTWVLEEEGEHSLRIWEEERIRELERSSSAEGAGREGEIPKWITEAVTEQAQARLDMFFRMCGYDPIRESHLEEQEEHSLGELLGSMLLPGRVRDAA
jgi:hypothetical protein